MFWLIFIVSTFMLLVAGFKLIKAWRNNADSEYAKNLGNAIYISPAIFIPAVYKPELRKSVVISNVLFIVGIALLIFIALKQ